MRGGGQRSKLSRINQRRERRDVRTRKLFARTMTMNLENGRKRGKRPKRENRRLILIVRIGARSKENTTSLDDHLISE